MAYAIDQENVIAVYDAESGRRISRPLPTDFRFEDPSLAWSVEESRFYVQNLNSKGLIAVNLGQNLSMQFEELESKESPELLDCYGRVSGRSWNGATDWGRIYNEDSCEEFEVWAARGLTSGLRVYRDDRKPKRILVLSVNPGLLHLPIYQFSDVAFLDGCNECLFAVDGYIYVLDIRGKRVGTVSKGERFIILTDRYRKKLLPESAY